MIVKKALDIFGLSYLRSLVNKSNSNMFTIDEMYKRDPKKVSAAKLKPAVSVESIVIFTNLPNIWAIIVKSN